MWSFCIVVMLCSCFFLFLDWTRSCNPTTNLYVLKVNKVERVEHNPVELVVEVPRPVVIEKTIEAFFFAVLIALEKRMAKSESECTGAQDSD